MATAIEGGAARFVARPFECCESLGYDDTIRCFLSGIQKTSEVGRYWFGWMRDYLPDILFAVPKWIGRQVRDDYILPLYDHPTPEDLATQELASQIRSMLVGEVPISEEAEQLLPQLQAVANASDIKKRAIRVTSGDNTYIFHTYTVTVKRSDGKMLRSNLISFYGNEVKREGETGFTTYRADTIDELAAALFLVSNAFPRVDSFDFYSLGAVMFESLKHLRPDEKDKLFVCMILDRAFSSTRKVAQVIKPFFERHLTYLGAWLSGWLADPEKAYSDFAQSFATLEGKTLIQFSAKYDSYFGGASGYDPSFLLNLHAKKMKVFEETFVVAGSPSIAHHSAPRDRLINHSEGKSASRFPLPMKELEAVSDAVVRSGFYKFHSGEECHESLAFGGNREDLDTILLRMYPMFRAFMNS